jgi:hypothetical protein
MNNGFLYNSYINYNKIKNIPATDFLDENYLLNKKYQIIGLYDTSNKMWYHGWAIYNNDKQNYYRYNKSKELLKYALNIEQDLPISINEQIIVRSMLINSKINIIDELQVDIILAVITFLLHAKNIVIYENKINNIKYYYVSF